MMEERFTQYKSGPFSFMNVGLDFVACIFFPFFFVLLFSALFRKTAWEGFLSACAFCSFSEATTYSLQAPVRLPRGIRENDAANCCALMP